MGSKGRLSVQSQGPEKAKAPQTYSGEMEDHTKETIKIKTKGQSQPVKTKKND
jgi:hypothetical protein